MSFAIYLSHPDVLIDPAIPVPHWSLSAQGKRRAEHFGRLLEGRGITRIVSSDETKAVETARIIGGILGLDSEQDREMGENDRSATGFVPPERFEALADAFFAHPQTSILGWETALDAQARIVAAINDCLKTHNLNDPLLLIGHGAVGTLFGCALDGREIDRRYDQKRAGSAYAFTLASRQRVCEWTPIEDWELMEWPEI